MSFQISQLLFLAFYGLIGSLLWKLKNTKMRAGLVVLGLIAMLFNPFKFQQDGIGSVERFKVETVELPERIVVESKSFQEKQNEELNKLKQRSKELTNEVH